MTTNPNDIIDAYEELKRLAKILGAHTLGTLVERVANEADQREWIALINDEDPREGGPEQSPPARLASVSDTTDETNGCPWCSEEVNARKLYRHVITRHRADLEEVYAEDGVKGVQETFTLNYQTAYGWAQRLTGEAA